MMDFIRTFSYMLAMYCTNQILNINTIRPLVCGKLLQTFLILLTCWPSTMA